MKGQRQMDVKGFQSGAMHEVVAAFEAGFAEGREVGAALSIIRGGETLLDIWGGYTDRARETQWQQDTLVCCFSISKAVTAIATLRAVDQGFLALDEKVAYYWPEFGQAGKADVTIRQLLSHEAGLPGFREPVPQDIYYDWSGVCELLAGTEPWWPPGSQHGYHARTFGFLLGEVIRRSTGITLNAWLQQEITEPLGIEFFFELSAAQQALCATMLPAKVKLDAARELPPAMQRMYEDFNNPTTPTGAAFQNPAMPAGYMNSPAFRAALIPAVNGHATARGITQLLANTGVVLSDSILEEARKTHARGADMVLKSHSHFGLGFMLWEETAQIGRPGCFGHAGAGGSLAFYDPEQDMAFAFLMNQMQEGVVTGGTTAIACVDALYRTLN